MRAQFGRDEGRGKSSQNKVWLKVSSRECRKDAPTIPGCICQPDPLQIQATAKNPSPFQLGSCLSQYLMHKHVSLISQIQHIHLSWVFSTSPCSYIETNLQEPHSNLLEEFKHVGWLESCEESCQGKRKLKNSSDSSSCWGLEATGCQSWPASVLHRDSRGAELQEHFR